jgi:enamine deaminase RidA (YjgF/YER057c/UK114 family)
MKVETVNPPFFVRPVGYAHMTRVAGNGGTLLLLGGVTGMDEAGRIVAPGDIAAQMERALANIKAAVEYAGGQVEQIVRMRIFTTDMERYRAHLPELGAVWQRQFGRHYPAMALLGVQALFDPLALVEIESEAILPPWGGA